MEVAREDWPADPRFHHRGRPRAARRGPGHCEAEGRDCDDITRTCYFIFDVGEKGEKAGEAVDQLGRLAEMGFQAAIGAVIGTWDVTPLEVIGSEVIPAVASL
jgi:hypothetical protein